MAYSGDPGSSNLDWVRFTIQDTVVPEEFTDPEINAVLAEQTAADPGKKYMAAADLLGILLTKWGSLGAGVTEKEVSRLRLKYGTDQEAREAIQTQMTQLRTRGSQLISAKPIAFRSVKGPGNYLR